MKTRIFLFISLLCFLSCNKKTVQLPETNSQLITEINDVSPIYFFYNEETQGVEFNRNNMIGTTNWLVNIDKRLSLKQVLPDLLYLQNKRDKDGMHKNDLARNYFTCSNPDILNLAFIDFTKVNYHQESITEFLNSNSIVDSTQVQVYINFKADGKIDIGKNFIIKASEHDSFKNDLMDVISTDELRDFLYLNFSQNVSFQDYISYKSVLLEFDTKELEVSHDEFIYK